MPGPVHPASDRRPGPRRPTRPEDHAWLDDRRTAGAHGLNINPSALVDVGASTWLLDRQIPLDRDPAEWPRTAHGTSGTTLRACGTA